MSLNGPATLDALRRQVEAIERDAALSESASEGCGGAGGVRFGLPALDALLPAAGLPRAALHEVAPASVEWDDGPTLGFVLALLSRLRHGSEPVLWLTAAGRAPGSDMHAPALAGFGLDYRCLLHVRCPNDGEALWAMEEALVSGAVSAVVAEIRALPRAVGSRVTRRLQLAAETAGRPALLIRRPGRVIEAPAAPAATSRWRVSALLSRSSASAWRVELLRCRGGRICGPEDSTFRMEWQDGVNDATGDFTMAAPLRDRQAVA